MFKGQSQEVPVQMHLNHNILQTLGRQKLILTCNSVYPTKGWNQNMTMIFKVEVIVQMHVNHNILERDGRGESCTKCYLDLQGQISRR